MKTQSLSGVRNEPVKGMHPRDITAAVWKAGSNLTQLALDRGFNEAFLRNTLQRPNLKGECIIADFIGTPVHLIWPDRYDTEGNPDRAKWRNARDAAISAPLSRRKGGTR